ncbi:MAG: hypothetical protein HC830_08055 [Bacteroidetes bacterium]|nr:hypothetical protein [Bacteroidota bacterium]
MTGALSIFNLLILGVKGITKSQKKWQPKNKITVNDFERYSKHDSLIFYMSPNSKRKAIQQQAGLGLELLILVFYYHSKYVIQGILLKLKSVK